MTDRYTSGEYAKNEYCCDFDSDFAPWKARKVWDIIKKNNLNPKTICDVGCGSGGISYNLQKYLPECMFTGYDISPDAMKLCLKNENDKLHFKLADFLEERDVYCDIILLLDVIEHLENYFQYLRDIKLMSNYKILHIPIENFSVALLYPKFQLGKNKKGGHLHFFTKELILQIIESLGYEIIDCQYTTTMEEPLRNWGWKDNLLMYPRKIFYLISPDITSRIFGGYSLMVVLKTSGEVQ